MRQIVLIAATLLVLGGFVARYADKVVDPRSQATAMTARKAAAPTPGAGPQTMVVSPGSGGHFHVEASIDNRRMQFVVDTGASMVTLRESDAARIGIRVSKNDFTAKIWTANGSILAAPIQLNMVDLGGLRVRDVSAWVLPDEALKVNLLGMTFLSKLRRFEYAGGKLVLEQ